MIVVESLENFQKLLDSIKIASIFEKKSSHENTSQLILKTSIYTICISFILFSNLGTYGSPTHKNAHHDSVVKHLDVREVKRFTGGMHNIENLAGNVVDDKIFSALQKKLLENIRFYSCLLCLLNTV